MIAQTKLQHVDLWDAWIDLQSADEAPTLYVLGSVYTSDRSSSPVFVKKEFYESDILVLQIQAQIEEEGYETEIMYAEELTHLQQYKSINIFAGNQLVIRIADVEVFA